MSKEEVKQKIIQTTIECIEQKGIQHATIRIIADMAGVNVAAINYHFGSKEQLFQIVMDATLNESFVNNINDFPWQHIVNRTNFVFFPNSNIFRTNN